MTPRWLRVAGGLALVGVAHLGCGRGAGAVDGRGSEQACPCEAAQIVDPALLAFLSRSRAAHHAADLALDGGDRQGAVRALEGIVTAPKPPGTPPEVAEVTADTYARLAEIRSEAGDFDTAARDVDEGLKFARAPSHYQGHLIEVAGVVEERRAKALATSGDREGAEAARKRALGYFERAITIQDQVITEALRGAPEKPR